MCYPSIYTALDKTQSRFLELTLQQAELLHHQLCDDDRWLVCNPAVAGQVAVLDTEAYFLLKQFCTPTALDTALSGKIVHFSELTQAITLFVNLGLLQMWPQFPPNREEVQPHTLSVWLHVTNACNLGCAYCYVPKSSASMAENTSRRAVDAVIRSAIQNHFGRIRLKYAGGEASLNLAHVLDIHDYATLQTEKHGLALSASLLSNGVYLSQRAIDQLKARQIGIMISLDGVGEYHDRQRTFVSGRGSFRYVDRTITKLLASNLVPHINVTVSQRNLDGLVQLIAYILERNMSFTLSYYRDNECSTHLRDLQFAEEQMIATMQNVFSYIEYHLPRRRLIDSLIEDRKSVV